jgi:hypothetical protein
MRGQDEQQLGVFSYVSSEQRIPHDHPLRQLRVMADEALRELKPRFSRLYAKVKGRKVVSITAHKRRMSSAARRRIAAAQKARLGEVAEGTKEGLDRI